MPGLLRTLDVLDEKGSATPATARSNEERDTPLIIDVWHPDRIVAGTEIINKNDRYMTDEETEYAVNRLCICSRSGCSTPSGSAARRARNSSSPTRTGTRSIKKPQRKTRELAQQLLIAGVDVILGSHPHVVQGIENVTVERNGQPYTGLVVYSMATSSPTWLERRKSTR